LQIEAVVFSETSADFY